MKTPKTAKRRDVSPINRGFTYLGFMGYKALTPTEWPMKIRLAIGGLTPALSEGEGVIS